jgi:hypothetical protein
MLQCTPGVACGSDSATELRGRHGGTCFDCGHGRGVGAIAGHPGDGCSDATVDGQVLVERSLTPFCDAARRLLDLGHDGSATLVMKHAGSDTVALKGRLSIAAGLSVADDGLGKPIFTKWAPRQYEAPPASFPAPPIGFSEEPAPGKPVE